VLVYSLASKGTSTAQQPQRDYLHDIGPPEHVIGFKINIEGSSTLGVIFPDIHRCKTGVDMITCDSALSTGNAGEIVVIWYSELLATSFAMQFVNVADVRPGC